MAEWHGGVEGRNAAPARCGTTTWDDDERIEQLLQRLERIDGVAFTGNRPRVAGDAARPACRPEKPTRLPSSQSSV